MKPKAFAEWLQIEIGRPIDELTPEVWESIKEKLAAVDFHVGMNFKPFRDYDKEAPLRLFIERTC